MKLNLHILILTICPFFAMGQSLNWAATFGGIGEDVTRDMGIDDSGNVYSTGYFTDSSDFDPSESDHILESTGWYDVFVQKLDSEGNLVWVISFGGESFDYGTSIDIDTDGNIYVTGVFVETVDFDPTDGIVELTSTGAEDIFVVKLNPEGQLLWAKNMGSDSYEESTGVSVDGNGNVYLTGYFNETGDYDPSENVYELTSNGGQDLFILKLNPDGDFLWAHGIGGPEQELSLAMDVDELGSAYLTGLFKGTVDFATGEDELEITATEGSDAFMLKINALGGTEIASAIGGTLNDSGADIAVDQSGNAYISGFFFGSIVGADETYTNDGFEDAFVVKINPFGSTEWLRVIQGEGFQNAYGIGASPDGKVIVSGYFSDTADFDPSENGTLEMTKESSEPFDAFYMYLNTNGDFISAGQFGGSNFLESHCSAADELGNLYFGGTFQNTVDLDPNAQEEANATSQGFRDSYVIKVSSTPTSTNDFDQLKDIQAYPNPTTSFVNIFIDSNESVKAFQIRDKTGRKVLEGQISHRTKQIDISNLSSGMYILQLDGYHTEKIIKQ